MTSIGSKQLQRATRRAHMTGKRPAAKPWGLWYQGHMVFEDQNRRVVDCEADRLGLAVLGGEPQDGVVICRSIDPNTDTR